MLLHCCCFCCCCCKCNMSSIVIVSCCCRLNQWANSFRPSTAIFLSKPVAIYHVLLLLCLTFGFLCVQFCLFPVSFVRHLTVVCYFCTLTFVAACLSLSVRLCFVCVYVCVCHVSVAYFPYPSCDCKLPNSRPLHQANPAPMLAPAPRLFYLVFLDFNFLWQVKFLWCSFRFVSFCLLPFWSVQHFRGS